MAHLGCVPEGTRTQGSQSDLTTRVELMSIMSFMDLHFQRVDDLYTLIPLQHKVILLGHKVVLTED